jgi:hypothetical protein
MKPSKPVPANKLVGGVPYIYMALVLYRAKGFLCASHPYSTKTFLCQPNPAEGCQMLRIHIAFYGIIVFQTPFANAEPLNLQEQST